MASSNSNALRNRLMVVLIALISIIPFTLAWYMAKNPELIKNRPKVNYGQLITPARPIAYEELAQKPLTAEETFGEVKGHWVIVQVALDPACNQLCKNTAVKTGRLRLMLNKDVARVRRLLLLPEGGEAAVDDLTKQDPTLLVASLSEALRRQLQEAAGAPLAEGGLILLDPLGNAMMWYPPGFDPYGVLRDLQRLLKNSQVG